MKGMILAAGKGTRVRPLTYELPKPMIPILGKPVMEYLIDELARYGIREIMVNISHLPDKLESYFGDGRRWGVEIGYSFEGHIEEGDIISQPIGSAGGMKKIQEFGGFFDETTIVLCGDALIDLNILDAAMRHKASGAIASVLVHDVAREKVSNYGVVVCDNDSRITSFQEKPSIQEAQSTLVNTGIYIFEPEVLDLIPSNQEYDIGSQLFPSILEKGLPFYAINLPFNWVDIGKMSDYWGAIQAVMQGHVHNIEIPGKQARPGVWVGLNVSVDWEGVEIDGPVYIGAGSRIEAGARIQGPTWIGHGCHVQAGACVERSILFEYTRIGGSGCISNAVVFGRHCVDRDGRSLATEGADLDWVGDARVRSANGPLEVAN
ncbi:MAG TPA: NDP-sugar synthase [Acidiferrobacteraceae bacterium]|nr:NDP-sugar synthase [Acidiferrobacteraceae bacterium]